MGRSLDVEGNQLTGSIPESLSSLTSLEFLDFGYNRMSGTVPKALTALQALR